MAWATLFFLGRNFGVLDEFNVKWTFIYRKIKEWGIPEITRGFTTWTVL